MYKLYNDNGITAIIECNNNNQIITLAEFVDKVNAGLEQKSLSNFNSEEIDEIRDKVLNPLTVINFQCEGRNADNVDISIIKRQCSAILEYINSLSNK